MKTNAWLVIISIAHVSQFTFTGSAEGAIIFAQDFSSNPSGPVSSYVNSTSPDSGQWNAIQVANNGTTTVAINNGALAYTRTSATLVGGSFTRSSDFSPVPQALIYKFDLIVSGNSAGQTKAATWQVGDGFTTGGNAAESSYHSRFGINFTTTPGTFQFRDIGGSANSGNFSGSQSVMWVINNSGATLSYLAPNGSPATVADDKWDLWAGNSLVFNEGNALLTGSSLTDLKFAFEGGIGTIAMDNFEIQAVPEPTNIALALFALSFVGISGGRTLFRSHESHSRPSHHAR